MQLSQGQLGPGSESLRTYCNLVLRLNQDHGLFKHFANHADTWVEATQHLGIGEREPR